MEQHLILFAMGVDRLGIVNELTQLASDCGCNIVDSRMAVFGDEFTLVLLVNGGSIAIAQIESRFPLVASELDLMTVMKRTAPHKVTELSDRLLIELHGQDKPGVLKNITKYLSKNHVHLFSFKAVAINEQNEMETLLEVALEHHADLDKIQKGFYLLCEELGINGTIKTLN